MTANPAHSLRFYLPLFKKQNKRTVLDYGSGNLRNSLFLLRQGYTVFAVDLPRGMKLNSIPRLTFVYPDELPKMRIKVDVVICTFVLNLIPQKARQSAFDVISGKMTKGGYLLVETKGITLSELDRLTLPKGFVRIHHGCGRYTQIVLYQYAGF